MSIFAFEAEATTINTLMDRTKELLESAVAFNNRGDSLSKLRNGARVGAIHEAGKLIHVMTNTLVSELHSNPDNFEKDSFI